MQMREWLNKNSAVVTVCAVVLLMLSLGFIILQMRGPSYAPRVVPVWFYDLEAGSLFTAKSNEIPPIQTPSGGQRGVRAYVFSCGECSESERFVGWLEMYTPEAKAAMIAPPPSDPDAGMDSYEVMERGHLVSDATGQRWVAANTEAGFKIMESMTERCGDQPANPCYPK